MTYEEYKALDMARKLARKNAAYCKGYSAYMCGVGCSSNPFIAGSDDHSKFLSGWYAAAESEEDRIELSEIHGFAD